MMDWPFANASQVDDSTDASINCDSFFIFSFYFCNSFCCRRCCCLILSVTTRAKEDDKKKQARLSQFVWWFGCSMMALAAKSNESLQFTCES